MTISDLLTLIGILLAISAFISERNREYVILKLSKTEIGIIAILILHIHFLLSYKWWRDKIDYLNYFEKAGFPTNEAWAYLLSIGILSYSIWKIFIGKFPLSRKNQLLSYYNKLLLRNDIPFLAQLIEKYHLNEVIKFLNKKKEIKITDETGIWQIDYQRNLKVYNKVIYSREFVYGSIIYYNIILNDSFLDNVANINPYLFSRVIQELNDQDQKDNEFVNRYLKILMTNKNRSFFREIRNNQNLGEFDAYSIDPERPILYALFNDIRVCSLNEAWRGIGEPAILEMHEEAKKEFSVLRESDREQESDTTWSFRITIAIWYFDIMVRQAITQDINDHVWMYYYRHFVSVIISNMSYLHFAASDSNRFSRNYDLIEDIFTKMMDWKDVILKTRNNKLLKCVYECIGQCIYELSITEKLRDEDKNYLINWVWEDLIKTYGQDDRSNEIVVELIGFGFEMFKRPSMLFFPDLACRREESTMYLRALQILWNKRDTSILTGILGLRAINFKTQVIDELIP
jgi:hypothetical protein